MTPYDTGYAGMDATCPFTTLSVTLMSIPFCIATALLHGAPSMRHMTTYDDAAVNRLVGSVTLVTDPDVPTLSCIIEATLADGTTVVEDLRMTARDYAYGWDETSALIRRIGAERSEEGRVGKGCVSQWRSRGSPKP